MTASWTDYRREDFDTREPLTLFDMPAGARQIPAEPGTLFAEPEPAAAELAGPVWVIPCSAEKAGHQAAPRDLYRGQMFRHTLQAAESAAARTGGRVLILSAFYGLVDPDGARLFPYNTKMTDKAAMHPSSITSQIRLMGLAGREFRALLPGAYFAALAAALRPLGNEPRNEYAGCRGIGDQRAVNARHIQRGSVQLGGR